MYSKILFITRGIPFPPIGGAPIRNWQNISAMSSRYSVGVLSLIYHGYEPEVIPESIPGVNFFRVCSTGSKNWFVRKLWNIGFIQKLIHPFFKLQSPVGAELQKILKEEFPADVIIFEDYPRWWDLFNFRKKGNKPIIIYDAHNLETQLHQDLFTLTQEIKSQAAIEGVSYLRQRLRQLSRLWVIFESEKRLVSIANQVWVCSNEDNKRFKERFGSESNTFLVPNTVNVHKFKRPDTFPCPASLVNRHNGSIILFPAIFNYLPNEEAAKLLITEILPGLAQRLPDVTICFAGAEPGKFLLEAAKTDERIIVTGAVQDIRPYFWNSAALIAPIQKGGGTRIKILEAFAAGLPVVSTTKGVEGIECVSGKHLIVADSKLDIINALTNILIDKSLSEDLAESAFELVSNRYSTEALNLTFNQWSVK